MSMLEGFTVFNPKEGVPYVSVTSNGVTFNRSVVMKMQYADHVLLLFNEDTRKMAIQRCDRDTPNATPFYRPRKNEILSVRWNNKDLINTIVKIMGWDLTIEGFKVVGDLIREEDAMIFDLDTARPLN